MASETDNIISHIAPLEKSALSILGALCPGGFAVGVNFVDRKPAWVRLCYPIEWQRHYVDNGLIQNDPTIDFAAQHVGHITWSELKAIYPNAGVFVDGPQFGINSGNTISVVRSGSTSIASGAGPEWDDRQVTLALSALSALDGIHTKTGLNLPPNHVLEVVVQMCRGLRDAEIADTLGVKIETVRQRRDRAYKLSDTTTPAALAAFAVRAGWLDRRSK